LIYFTACDRKGYLLTFGHKIDGLEDNLCAKELNRRDGFVMWEDDPVEQKKWRTKKAEKERKKKAKREKERVRDDEKKKKVAKQLKKEKWGEHRTTERKNESMEDRDVTMRDVSPGDY